jgi:hypothetical protein
MYHFAIEGFSSSELKHITATYYQAIRFICLLNSCLR